MASQHLAGGKRYFRHRLKVSGIRLEPGTSRYDISIELFIDGKKVHKLPTIKSGRQLHWSDLTLPCHVQETSEVTIWITDIRTFRDERESVTYHVSQVMGQDAFSIESNAKKYTTHLSFMSEKEAERAYRVAFIKTQQMESQVGVIQRAGKVGAAFKLLLALGSTMAELDPTGGAKVTFAVCTQAWERLEQQDQQDTDINNFVENLARMIPSIESVERLADARLAETVMAMLNLIEDASLFILNFKSRNPWARILYSATDSTPQEQMEAFVVNFKRLREEFDTRVGVQTFGTIQTDSIRSKLQELKPVHLAGYDSTRGCMPETRVAIIHDITTWVSEWSSDQCLAWVHGLAGLGKSSIATSVCQQLDEQGTLGASFFCKRDNPELRSPCRVLATVAYSLSMKWKSYGDAVIELIRADPDLHSQHIRPLYDMLVGKPLRSLVETKRPVTSIAVVVDALDECGDLEGRRQLLMCLRDMSRLAPWLKVVITSRPDVDIQEFFGQHRPANFTPYNVLSYDSRADIRVFVRAQLEHLNDINSWPEDAVDQLSDRSSGLFIWARTACKYIVAGHNPLNRLKQVLAGTRLANSSAELDALYTTAIRAGAVDEDEDNLSYVLQCLGLVVVTATRRPLSVLSLSRLLRGRLSEYTISHVLQSLSSVLYLDHANDDAIRISHPSFMDYITDSSRSKELCVDLDKQNAMLAECCLETMTTELRFNICDLETSHLLNHDVQNLNTRVRDAIRAHLSYSCIYWTSHLTKTGGDLLDASLRTFLFGREALYWIEALSLLGKLNAATSNLLEVTRAPNVAKDCQTCAHDLYRFVLSFYDVISESAPHLYMSALALAPEKSKVVQRVRHHFPNMLMVIQGAQQDWTPCLRTIWARDRVNAVQFSPDGRSFATGLEDATVRLWDAETGASLLEPLRGHSESVQSVAFSPNGRFIASGSDDRTIRVWNLGTGTTALEPLRGHSGAVLSIAFTLDGHRIVSGSLDNAVRVWDAETGTGLLELQDHSDAVLSVALSPDSRRITSGSMDGTIRVWDVETGAALLGPLHGHRWGVSSVTFSPDGHCIISSSWDGTIHTWDADTGATLLEIQGESYLYSLALSPNGRFVVSGHGDCTVRVWDVATGAAVLEPLQGHSESVYSVGFSSDGRRIVSGSLDKTLRIWDTEMSNAQFKPSQESGVVQAVAFSADNRSVASTSRDTMLRIWDAETGHARSEPLQGHSGTVWSVAFLPDSRRVVSGSEDKTVRVWDTETGATLLGPLHGHTGGVKSVAVSPSGHRIASSSDDGTIRIWDAGTGVTLVELRGHTSGVQSVAFSSDGRMVFSGSSDFTVRIWDVETGSALLEPLQGHSDIVHSVSASPRGHCVASGSSDHTVRIWNTDTGAVLLEPLLGHSGAVRSVAFSSDGRMIVSGAADWTVRVWDAETGAQILVPLRERLNSWYEWGIYSVAFSPDNRRIVSGSGDSSVRIWDIDTCMRAGAHEFLPGTQIPVLSKSTHSQLLLTSSILARHLNSNGGWVTTERGELVLWLPPDLRGPEDSTICIAARAPRRRMVMDFTKFVHGSSWSSIATM